MREREEAEKRYCVHREQRCRDVKRASPKCGVCLTSQLGAALRLRLLREEEEYELCPTSVVRKPWMEKES